MSSQNWFEFEPTPTRRETIVALGDYNTFMPTRREGLLGLGFLGLAGCELERQKPDIANLGLDIEKWTLADGTRVVSLYPEVQRAADLIRHRSNLSDFVPFAKQPLRLLMEGSDAALSRNLRSQASDPTRPDPRRVLITMPSGRNEGYLWLNKDISSLAIKMSPEIVRSSVRLPIGVKEASSALDYMFYARLYLRLAGEQGLSFDLRNPTNIPTPDDEFVANAAEDIANIEIRAVRKSLFDELVDFGSHIRTGGILYGTWYYVHSCCSPGSLHQQYSS